MVRVLIGEFGAITRRGLKEVLVEQGCEVVAEETAGQVLLHRLVHAFPDVVVLDLDHGDGDEVAAHVSSVFPAMKVIAFSTDEPTMRVFPAFHGGESYRSSLSTRHLLEAINQS